MRKLRNQKNGPREGDKRIARVFLFLPKEIDDDWRWWEWARIEQRFHEGDIDRGFSQSNPTRKWIDVRWMPDEVI